MIALIKIIDIYPAEIIVIPLETLDVGDAADIPRFYARTFSNGASEIAVEVTRDAIQIYVWARGHGLVRCMSFEEPDVDYSDVELLQLQMPYSFFDKYINDDALFTYDMAKRFHDLFP